MDANNFSKTQLTDIKRFVNSTAFPAFFDQVYAELIETFVGSRADDVEAREGVYQRIHAIKDVQATFGSLAEQAE